MSQNFYTNKAGVTFRLGDTIHYVEGDGRFSKEYGVIVRFPEGSEAWPWAKWFSKDSGEFDVEAWVDLDSESEQVSHYNGAEASTLDVQKALDFLLSKGYTVSLSKQGD